jgi:hypothetical protein
MVSFIWFSSIKNIHPHRNFFARKVLTMDFTIVHHCVIIFKEALRRAILTTSSTVYPVSKTVKIKKLAYKTSSTAFGGPPSPKGKAEERMPRKGKDSVSCQLHPQTWAKVEVGKRLNRGINYPIKLF